MGLNFIKFALELNRLAMRVRLSWRKQKEIMMTRKYVDCREFPSEMNCSVVIAADSEKELLDVAVQHAVSVHQHKDGPELRKQIRSMIREGTPSTTGSPPKTLKTGKSSGDSRPHGS
jgi:predicted small metal-binding protein